MEAAFDWRWTVRALRVRGVLPKWFLHYDAPLVDQLFTVTSGLDIEGGAFLPGWSPITFRNPFIPSGIALTLEAQKATRAS